MNITFNVESSNVWKASEGLLYTIVYAPNNPASKDLQGDWIGRTALRDCAHTYLESGEVRLNHAQRLSPDKAKVVESYVLDEDSRVQGRLCKAGTWIAVFKLNDPDLIQMVRNGQLRGVSIAGTAKRQDSGELYNCSITELSLVSSPASGIPFITLKSAQSVTEYIETPEGKEKLRELQSAIADLKATQERNRLQSEQAATPKLPRRYRTQTFEDFEALAEHRNRQQTNRDLYDRCAESARPLLDPSGKPYRKFDVELF